MNAQGEADQGIGVELTDEDCYEAMRQIPGYLDISIEDFRDLYRLAVGHAAERLMGGIRAGDLMTPQPLTLTAELPLDRAVKDLAAHSLKGAPVLDASGKVVAMLSETDVLRHLGAATWLAVLVRHRTGDASIDRCCRDSTVGDVMTAPAVCVLADARIPGILAAFRTHPGRRMPVVDGAGRLLGMLARKDLLARLEPR